MSQPATAPPTPPATNADTLTEHRNTIRHLIAEARRHQHGLPQAPQQGHGYEGRYKNGCRCPNCTQAANQARANRRRREREQRTCHRCHTVFRWPGLLYHHHSTSRCWLPK